MAAFSSEDANDGRLDWTILRDGGVALYWRAEILTGDLNWLESNGYRIVTFDAGGWLDEHRLHESLRAALSFPAYYGNNLDALDECMRDDVAVPDAGGLVLVLNHYDRFVKTGLRTGTNKGTAEVVLDIFARASRYHMLLGRRLLILVQSDDPEINFGLLGGISASWNSREWLNKNRGL